MTMTALNPASAEPRNSPSNLSVVTLPDKSGLTTRGGSEPPGNGGQDSMPSAALHPLRGMIDKLWAPVPWMLEAAIVFAVSAAQGYRGSGHRVSTCFQCSFGILSGGEKRKQHSRP